MQNAECAYRSLWEGKALHLCTSRICTGLKPARKGELNWYVVPSNENLRKHLWRVAIWMWKYASFRSMESWDLLQRHHPERAFLKRSVDGPQVQYRTESSISLGHHKIVLYCSFCKQTENFLSQNRGILRQCQRQNQATEAGWSVSKLERIPNVVLRATANAKCLE